MAKGTYAKSDDLPRLREVFLNNPWFLWAVNIVQIPLIVDASAIIEDIRWLSCVAENPKARTNLLEAIQAKTVVAYAPTFLDEELEKNIRLIAEEEDVSVETLQVHWERYRRHLHFVDCGGPDDTYLDPKDAPYVKLQRKLDAPVSTRDSHFAQMGVPIISVERIAAARDYSREAAVEYTIKIAGIGSLIISAAMMRGAWELLRSLGIQIQRLPGWISLVVICIACAALLSERTRTWLLEKVKLWGPGTREAIIGFADELRPLFEQHYESQRRANESRNVLVDRVDV